MSLLPKTTVQQSAGGMNVTRSGHIQRQRGKIKSVKQKGPWTLDQMNTRPEPLTASTEKRSKVIRQESGNRQRRIKEDNHNRDHLGTDEAHLCEPVILHMYNI